MADQDPSSRPSRRGWPLRTHPTTTPAGTHEHDLPRWVLRTFIGFGVVLLLILGVMAVDVIHQQTLHDYRNQENARLHEQIRQGLCDLLDQLPQSPVLDGPRHKYHCGPGIPSDQLPPAIQKRWGVVPPPTSTTPAGAPVPSRPSPNSP